MYWFRLYLMAVIVFFGIDLIWLGIVAQRFYQQQIGFLLSPRVNWPAAITFYLLYVAGMVFFALRPAIVQGSWQTALLTGAFFGFITYATYDLTNLATLKDWPLLVTLVDLAWGTTLGAAVTTVTFLITRALHWQ
ncbi:DUF2177 family protein [Anoxynatronum buryatiense]|uniref:Uncharacterized membrane protein n=1 Tax=Anoxynatronum buryatiense TaxID=489973 RepID=A0AA46AHX5_9CLOT|nr:DUF2177 family protein [Anoxynatronum buryatiense]SMP44452.1 Uncharacterized membrane protein [Anoxynatronum buryatiense]